FAAATPGPSAATWRPGGVGAAPWSPTARPAEQPPTPEELRYPLSLTDVGRAALREKDTQAYQAGQTPAGRSMTAEQRKEYLSATGTGQAILRDEEHQRMGPVKT